jgi:hypothetical protein
MIGNKSGVFPDWSIKDISYEFILPVGTWSGMFLSMAKWSSNCSVMHLQWRQHYRNLLLLAYHRLGVVYGHLSTPPLYVHRSKFSGRICRHQDEQTIFSVSALISGPSRLFLCWSMLLLYWAPMTMAKVHHNSFVANCLFMHVRD